MKLLNKLFNLLILAILGLLMFNCEDVITEFGNDRSISGFIIDESGNIVPGDITSTNLTVKALGEGDVVSTDMRVNGEGFFRNKRLYPKKYKIFVTGPVTPLDDTLHVDLFTNKSKIMEIKVTPFLTLTKPTIVGNPTESTIDINYEIVANSGKNIFKRELYCSTIPYPNYSTGSGPFYSSKTVKLDTDSGIASITELDSKTTYYIRVGAQAVGASGFNYSEQIMVTTE